MAFLMLHTDIFAYPAEISYGNILLKLSKLTVCTTRRGLKKLYMYLFYVWIFNFDATIKSHYLFKHHLTYTLVSDTHLVPCEVATEFLGSPTPKKIVNCESQRCHICLCA
jgi:hypothetical protein